MFAGCLVNEMLIGGGLASLIPRQLPRPAIHVGRNIRKVAAFCAKLSAGAVADAA
jgi:hypothetical protein